MGFAVGQVDQIDVVLFGEAESADAMLGVAEAGLADRILRGPADPSLVPQRLRGSPRGTTLIDDQRALLDDATQPLPIRRAATRLLVHLVDTPEGLADLVAHPEPAIREEALAGLRVRRDLPLPSSLLASLGSLSPSDREAVLAASLASTQRQRQLLAAVDGGRVDPLLVDANRAARLRESDDPGIAGLARELLPETLGLPPETWTAYAAALHPTDGDRDRGRAVFAKSCAPCHAIGGAGGAVGPDLSDLRTKTREQLLEAILRPNAAIDAAYVGYVARTVDGRVVTGVIRAESETAITLRGADGRDVSLLRDELEAFKTTGKSLMPAGMERTIGPDAMSDLVHYLKTWRYK